MKVNESKLNIIRHRAQQRTFIKHSLASRDIQFEYSSTSLIVYIISSPTLSRQTTKLLLLIKLI